VLCEPRLTDPDIRYARAVLTAILDPLRENGSLSLRDYDDAIMAFGEGVEKAAEAVARAWLRERRSLPIDVE
jgi:hypothetical protein